MKNRFNQLVSDISVFLKKSLSDIKNLKQNKSNSFYLLLGGIGLALLACVAFVFMVYTNTLPKSSPDENRVMPEMLATTTMDPMRQAATTPTPTYTPTATPSPIPSNLWVVNQLLGKQTIGGYTALVVEFKNLSTGELHNGQCQEPRDPAPAVGDIFVAEITSDHVLLSPTIAGTSQVDVNSKVQHFVLLR